MVRLFPSDLSPSTLKQKKSTDFTGWGGHWRGENATDETVICELSYQTRRSLSTMCALGYTVSESETNTFWAGDLLHRLYHMPAIGQGLVEHYADGYEGVLELAEGNRTEAVHDSETLQYFALEVYAYDIVVPGVGCVGGEEELADDQTEETEEAPADEQEDEAADEEIPEVSWMPTLPAYLPYLP
jgi:hypothetical protein